VASENTTQATGATLSALEASQRTKFTLIAKSVDEHDTDTTYITADSSNRYWQRLKLHDCQLTSRSLCEYICTQNADKLSQILFVLLVYPFCTTKVFLMLRSLHIIRTTSKMLHMHTANGRSWKPTPDGVIT